MIELEKLILLRSLKGVGEPPGEYTASGNPMTFETNLAKPLKSLTASFSPAQAGSGDPSPSNVRNISGIDGIKITHMRKNLLDPATFSPSYTTESNGTFTFTKSGYNVCIQTGQNGDFTVSQADLVKCPFLKAGTYVLSTKVTSGSPLTKVYRVDSSGTIYTQTMTTLENNVGGYYSYRFSLSVDTRIVVLRSGNSNPAVFTEPMIEAGTARTAYEPYIGQVYDVAFPDGTGTVYGGTVDLTTGVLTVTHKSVMFNGNEGETWTKDGVRYYTTVLDVNCKPSARTSVLANIGKYAASGYTNYSVFVFGWLVSGGTEPRLYFYPPNTVTTAEEFKIWLAENNLQVVYDLATPQTAQIDPVTIKTLKGVNTVWSDANGTMEATYYKKG